MDVELSHHYGWRRYSTDAQDLGEAAYKAVRQSHDFLTDTNHTYDARTRHFNWGGKVVRYSSVRVYRGEGAPKCSAPDALKTDYWFAVEYREPKNQEPERHD